MSRQGQNTSIVEMVAELEQRYNELKQTQIIGSDSVRTFKANSSDTLDFNASVGAGIIKEIIVTFTPDNTAGKSTAGAYALKYAWNNAGGLNIQRMRVDSFDEQKWRVTVQGGGSTVQLKFWVLATGKGTLSFTVL